MKLTSLTLSIDAIEKIIVNSSDKLSENIVADLKETAPVDDTTKEKAKYIYNKTGKRAWIKDDIESRLYWQAKKSSVNRGKVSNTIENDNPAVIALALGFISLKQKGYEPVERTSDGTYSEQDPKGMYAVKSIKRAMRKSGFKNIELK